MPKTISVVAPDGSICEVIHAAWGFSAVRWRAHIDDGTVSVPSEPSPALRRCLYSSPHDAMLAAYRERLQQEQECRPIPSRRAGFERSR